MVEMNLEMFCQKVAPAIRPVTRRIDRRAD